MRNFIEKLKAAACAADRFRHGLSKGYVENIVIHIVWSCIRSTQLQKFDRRVLMELISSFAIVVAATFLSTWFNDHIAKGEYIADE